MYFVMQNSRSLKEAFHFNSMYSKTITVHVDLILVISRIIKVSVKGCQPQPSTSAYNYYLDLDYSGYHKNIIQYFFIIIIKKL